MFFFKYNFMVFAYICTKTIFVFALVGFPVRRTRTRVTCHYFFVFISFFLFLYLSKLINNFGQLIEITNKKGLLFRLAGQN